MSGIYVSSNGGRTFIRCPECKGTGQNAAVARGITVADLLSLIDGLDHIDNNDYLDLTRWDRHGSGEDDTRLTAVTRQLARDRLGGFPVEDVGIEILRQIDQRKPEAAASEAATPTERADESDAS